VTEQVAVLSTGGTIASTDSERGAGPSKRGEALVEVVPGLRELADIEVQQVAQRSSNDMDTETMADVARAARDAVDTGSDGVVVTHGTDTMEESAYYLDLVDGIDAPVVFTGAQRRPDEVSPDGPHNLLASVRTVVDSRFQDGNGSFVVFSDEIHAARHVTKVHTTKLNTFSSPEYGCVGTVTRDGVRQHRPVRSWSESIPVVESDSTVRIVPSMAGADGAMIDRAIEHGVDGLVVEATGLGNTTGDVGDAVASAIESGVPVVIASRCVSGGLSPIYGGRGGAKTLWEHGVLDGDSLSPQKARLKLKLALAAADSTKDAAEYF